MIAQVNLEVSGGERRPILGVTWITISKVPLNISKSADISYWRDGANASVQIQIFLSNV